METSIKYAAHLNPIQLPTIKIPEPSQLKTDHSFTQSPFTFAVIENHQYYLQQQTELFDYLLKKQEILWQQYIALHYPATHVYPQFTRQDLEGLASGTISSYFGEWFKPLDQYQRLIRMPEPPLLLTDRITKIDAAPGSLKTGTIYTETDVTEDAWYLHHGRMPAGIMIESGQSDLLLASWLGFDFYNQGQRIYRLLGCELSYHGELPKPGDTLCYDIHIDGQAKHGDIRLFFFHYDCRINGELRLKVRHGQAGFFSDQELLESGGVLWDPTLDAHVHSLPHDSPSVQCTRNQFSQEQLKCFASGDVYGCFGKGYELTQTHTRTPSISNHDMLFLNEITHFDPTLGPHQRGYIRALQHVHPDDWFFKGHFKNDPCMPGTLMLEAGLQLIAFYLTGLGYTLDKDGWRFEPIPEQTFKLRCRAQVRPTAKQIVYEMFVTQIIEKPIPMIYGDLLGTVDGLKAFHTKIGVRLIPDWPLTLSHPLLKNDVEPKSVAEVNGFKFDYFSLLACAFGKPSDAFGEIYRRFDNHRRVARLPGPPYHFMNRITHVQGKMGELKVGAEMECEYDMPIDAWYFQDNPGHTMPFCVFLEAALQPCGWLGSYMGSTLHTNEDVFFRNLDGVGTLTNEIPPGSLPLRTRVKCTNLSRAAGISIENFDVQCFLGEQKIYEMQTVFGFFPLESLKNQIGLPVPESETDILNKSSELYVDLLQQPTRYFAKPLALPTGQLLMIDRITGFWQQGGKRGLGQLRAEKTVHPDEWFFKAHFFQDPVQPGSLGIEAMNQVLQFYMLHNNLQKNIVDPLFEPLALNIPLIWKCRGQVLPSSRLVHITMDIIEEGNDAKGVYAIADAALWVDGKRIYEARNFGLRIIPKKLKGSPTLNIFQETIDVDPKKELWIDDHRPTYLIPSLPLMGAIHYMTQAVRKYFPAKKMISIKEVKMLRWVVIDQPIQIKIAIQLQNNDSAQVKLSTLENNKEILFAKGNVYFANAYPLQPTKMPVDLINQTEIQNPYFHLFHGKSLQIVQSLLQGENGADSIINVPQNISYSVGNPILLDATMHSIPSDQLTSWCKEISDDQVGYPCLITQMMCYDQPPSSGQVNCKVRFSGFHESKRFPKFDVTVSINNKIWVDYQVVYALFSKGPLHTISPENRRSFLQHKNFVPGISLSTLSPSFSSLEIKTVKNNDWLPGSVAALFEVKGDEKTMTKHILIKEHFSALLKVHPSEIIVHDEQTASCKNESDKTYSFNLTEQVGKFMIRMSTP
ncbi:MAG: hypothetical protein A3F12_06510 [Gammaproteobacteria bacterium RIFCSPHIGHO2_12_FULL_38_14]|nr:MAG: hypothetical protein A3F12_06510 [Gammaproteobacteria bacterium RIFCSPHIGHO2_12_FULL_38_14]